MDGTAPLLLYTLVSVGVLTMLSIAGLRAWRGWLELRRAELLAGAPGGGAPDLPSLRARVKRLEAIASGLDG